MEEPSKSILQKQYKLMEKRLWYGITWPSAILTGILGTLLVTQYGMIPNWLWIKIGFVVLLYVYHFFCHRIFMQQQNNIIIYTSTQLRIFNELATVLLFAIVFLVILKNTMSWIYGLLALAIFTGILMLAISIYKKIRSKS